MEGTGAAIAIAAAALVLVVVLNRRSEAQTAAMLTTARKQQQQGDGALSFAQVFEVGATALATYLGGPESGYKVLGTVTK